MDLLFIFFLGLATTIIDAQVLPNSVKSTTTSIPCCDRCACAQSDPPYCSCQDVKPTCHSACKDCRCSETLPLKCVCHDTTTFCYEPCNSQWPCRCYCRVKDFAILAGTYVAAALQVAVFVTDSFLSNLKSGNASWADLATKRDKDVSMLFNDWIDTFESGVGNLKKAQHLSSLCFLGRLLPMMLNYDTNPIIYCQLVVTDDFRVNSGQLRNIFF
ncbi:hypothetical protein TSUD_248200 [Trifolium subterraneum]|uniref:Bowman-Birk serine protease inhibitors family domain-containing protein n=1 Tax=Trifolium subterraneum TaxID=3900 RepID=A0A2Z6LK15_TRISU|nr:hypothetical protein TSUD_248200 [Trifolium subterraneum]